MADRQERAPRKAVKSDDSTTTISKMLSWLLRHGAKHKANALEVKDGWVKVKDVLQTEYFKEVSEETLMKVIIDSNAQKLRYQLSVDLVYIRAYSSEEKKALKEVPVKSAVPVVPERKDGTLRSEAPEFVPSQSSTSAPTLPGAGFWPGFHPSMLPYVPVQVASKTTTGPVPRELGRIKSFNEEKGYGFIDCPRVFQQFGRDAFVHKAQMNGFKVGDEVTLVVTLNDSGLPQAKDLQSTTGKPGTSSSGKGKGKSKGKGKEKTGKGDSSEKAESKGKGKDGKGKDGKSKDGKGKDGKGKKKDKKTDPEETADAKAASEDTKATSEDK
eukprot:TRINITY_DN332_c1_g4_i1.p1 TRINITY_DN332_c1_g4~~TRINITY_DN332_c1_g4_i1.p1  ORF type:complete len:349 (-),score=103.38 TRINITY_DN332_c1_g4_i1:83-1063(-)